MAEIIWPSCQTKRTRAGRLTYFHISLRRSTKPQPRVYASVRWRLPEYNVSRGFVAPRKARTLHETWIGDLVHCRAAFRCWSCVQSLSGLQLREDQAL